MSIHRALIVLAGIIVKLADQARVARRTLANICVDACATAGATICARVRLAWIGRGGRGRCHRGRRGRRCCRCGCRRCGRRSRGWAKASVAALEWCYLSDTSRTHRARAV